MADPKRQWAKNPSYPVRDFPAPPPSGILFSDVGMTKDLVPRAEQRIRYPLSEKPTFFLAYSLFRSRLLRQEFPWVPINFPVPILVNKTWGSWVDHVFTKDLPFVEVLKRVGVADAIWASKKLAVQRRPEDATVWTQRWSSMTYTFVTAWGEFSPTLEDVVVLLKLPVFGELDLASYTSERHIVDMAKALRQSTVDVANYSRRLFTARRAQ